MNPENPGQEEVTPDGEDSHAELLALVYGDLRRLAAVRLSGEAPGQTLQPTALVHEAWMRLAPQTGAQWRSPEQFCSVAAEVMRRILVDRARRRQARRHGGALVRVPLDADEVAVPGEDPAILEVHEALDRLAEVDPEKAEIVKLRFFAGLEHSEIAALLGVSEVTARRHWTFARAWLQRALRASRS